MIKLIIGILFLPSAVLFIWELVKIIYLFILNYNITMYFLIGCVLYLLTHMFFFKFSRLYVFAHEITHFISAWLFGYKVHDISIKQNSGHIRTDKINTFILLSPYFVPLYALTVSALYFLLSIKADLSVYNSIFLTMLGCLFTFHLVHTFKSIVERQSDLYLAGGLIFSVSLVAIINSIIMIVILSCIFSEFVDVKQICFDVFNVSIYIWELLFLKIYGLVFRS